MDNQKKQYRLFRGKTHAILGYWFIQQAYFNKNIALIPTKVDDKWIWLKSYYSLKMIDSTFNFGGTTTYSYKTKKRSLSYFSFKKELKNEGIIRNLFRQKIESFNKIKSMPKWFKDKINN